MRRPRHVILLLALEALSRSLVLCSETGTAAGRAAVSEELPTRTAGVAVGGGSNPSSQDRGGDDGRQRWHDAASWVEGEGALFSCCWEKGEVAGVSLETGTHCCNTLA